MLFNYYIEYQYFQTLDIYWLNKSINYLISAIDRKWTVINEIGTNLLPWHSSLNINKTNDLITVIPILQRSLNC